MRVVIMAVFAAVALAAIPVRAEAQTALPEITVGPLTPKPGDHKGDSDAKVGTGAKGRDDHTLDRLNQQLKRKVDEANPIGNNPPLDAQSPDTKTGVVNIPGVQQQYGQNFGHSVIPFRPGQPVAAPPLGSHR
jgi:hypothetical protein